MHGTAIEAAALPAESRPDQTRSGFPWFAWVMLLALILYPLSIGPVAKLVVRPFQPTPRAFEVLYSPVLDFAGASPFLERLLEWYLFRLWNVQGGGSPGLASAINGGGICSRT
jgi:hypothetical protein